jgi:N,N'-diacetyllegionaminate synthase
MMLECFVIAEIGSNHNGEIEEAHRLIDAAAQAGCNAAKFQTYSAETLYSRQAPRLAEMNTFHGDDGQVTPFELISALQMPRKWHGELAAHCIDAGIEFMSTPFDLDAVDDLDRYVQRHKVASYDLTNITLVQECARTGKPLILSTGHAFLGEVEAALRWVAEVDPSLPVTLLHCTSQYPTKPEDVNLRAMGVLATAFQCDVGLSDHTLGTEVAIASVALGATMIEKHFTADRSQNGPDHSFALEPLTMAAMVASIRTVEVAIGDGLKAPRLSELENRRLARRSIHVAHNVSAGHPLTAEDLVILRPGTGIAPEDMSIVTGRKVRHPMTAGTVLTWDDI